MIILAIESSCDDTSVALLEIDDTTHTILNEKTASQIEVHKKYGGVVPEIAGRKHAENILPVIEEVMHGQPKPDYIAVTAGPGLITGLLVGVEAAKTLSYLWNIPLIPVNHLDGHIHSVRLLPNADAIEFPAICLIVSGGHSELLLMKNHNDYTKIGGTRDDAAGEAFDKAAKMLGLDYPGGPQISRLGEQGNPHAIPFPRPMHNSDDYDMSFAGLKTAALYWLKEHATAKDNHYTLEPSTQQDFAASFEQAIVDVLCGKTIRAVTEFQPKQVILAGGVSANKKLRETLQAQLSVPLLLCPPAYSMDNAAMIGVAAYYQIKNGVSVDWKELDANTNWKVYTPYTPRTDLR